MLSRFPLITTVITSNCFASPHASKHILFVIYQVGFSAIPTVFQFICAISVYWLYMDTRRNRLLFLLRYNCMGNHSLLYLLYIYPIFVIHALFLIDIDLCSLPFGIFYNHFFNPIIKIYKVCYVILCPVLVILWL